MNIRPISGWTLYKYRFAISYLFLALLVGILLLTALDHIPPGISHSEQQSALNSTAVSFTELPTRIIDLPYHALQKISLDIFGVTPLGLRLPSLIFGALMALCISLILRRWFQTNVAIVCSIVLLSSGWYLSMARLGTPMIMIPFWTSVLILAATYISQQTRAWKWWKIVFAFAAGLSLYTPFMAYLFLAAFLAALFQPHLRYLLREGSKFHITLGTFFFTALMVPLGWGIYKDPNVIRELLAVPAILPEPLQFGRDILQAIGNVINPYAVNFGEITLPLLSIATSLLLAIGAMRLLSDFHSVRAYVLLIWAAFLVPIIGFNPQNLAVLLVPVMLVVAIGLQLVVRYWYKLFPFNPYARIFGLIPLIALLISIVHLNVERYFYGYLYSKDAVQTFSQDEFLAQRAIQDLPANNPLTVVVSEPQVPLYKLMTRNRPNTVVATARTAEMRSGTWLISEQELGKMSVPPAPVASEVVVSDRKEKALRFRIYNR